MNQTVLRTLQDQPDSSELVRGPDHTPGSVQKTPEVTGVVCGTPLQDRDPSHFRDLDKHPRAPGPTDLSPMKSAEEGRGTALAAAAG